MGVSGDRRILTAAKGGTKAAGNGRAVLPRLSFLRPKPDVPGVVVPIFINMFVIEIILFLEDDPFLTQFHQSGL